MGGIGSRTFRRERTRSGGAASGSPARSGRSRGRGGGGGGGGRKGGYRVADVPAGTHTIRVSSIGFTRQERQIRVSAGETTVANIELSSAVIDLEEILVTGAPGATRRRGVGGSAGRGG